MTEEQKQRFAEALARVSGDCDLLSAMAAIVAEDAPSVLNELRERVAANDMLAASALAHKLKGMLSTFETEGPVLDLEDLIVSARNGRLSEAKAAFHSSENQVEDLLSEIISLDKCS